MKYEMCEKYAGKILRDKSGQAYMILDNNYPNISSRFALLKYNEGKEGYCVYHYTLDDDKLAGEKLYVSCTGEKLYFELNLGDRYERDDEYVYYLCEINHLGIKRYCVATEDSFSRVHREIFDTMEEVHDYMVGWGYSHYSA